RSASANVNDRGRDSGPAIFALAGEPSQVGVPNMGGVLKKLLTAGVLLLVVAAVGRNPASQGTVVRAISGQPVTFGRDSPAEAVQAALDARSIGDERGVLSVLDPAVKVNPFEPIDQFSSVVR